MQVAGLISDNNIQEFLVGSQYPKSENLVRNPEVFLTFFVGRIKPSLRVAKNKFVVLTTVKISQSLAVIELLDLE